MYRNLIAAIVASSAVTVVGSYLEEQELRSLKCTVTATNENGDTQEFSATGSKMMACMKAREAAEKWCKNTNDDEDDECTIGRCICLPVESREQRTSSSGKEALATPVMENFSCRISCVTKTSNEQRTSTGPTKQAAWNNLLLATRPGGGIAPGSVKVQFIPRNVGRATGSVFCVDETNRVIVDYGVSGTDATGMFDAVALEALDANAGRVEEAASANGWRAGRNLSSTVVKVPHYFASETTVAVQATANNDWTIYVTRREYSDADALAAAKARAIEIANDNNGVKTDPVRIEINTLPGVKKVVAP